MAKLIQLLMQHNVELIFFDELSINSNTLNCMDEKLKEEKLALFVQNRHNNFSVIVGLSQYRYFGVMITDGTFNSS